jgi:outer membrane protein OmpA-like peptidoglycan-associated protein
VAVGDGKVQWRRPDGTLTRVLETGRGDETSGMGFDSQGNLYVTGFDAAYVSKFDRRGNLLGTFGEGYDCHPESIIFGRSGNAYVGQAIGPGQCGKKMLKFDPAGRPLAVFAVATDYAGSDWLDLAADQCTMYYTSEGHSVKRFDVCANRQLPDFATKLPGQKAFAFRLLPAGGLLVADKEMILRFDGAGKIVRTYKAEGENFFALNLDPDGKSFWSAGLDESRNIYKFNIENGQLLLKFNADSASAVGGLAVFGEIATGSNTTQVTQEQGKIRVTMESAILFDFNRSDLKPAAETALAGIKTSIIDKHPGAKLVIEGHTDDVGTEEYNQTLSETRARAVADWLRNHGIEAARLATKGYGKSKPKYPNTSDDSRARNRRVEIVVVID